ADPRSLATRVIILGNLLKPAPQYQRSLQALKNPDASPGRPIERFLRLPSPSPEAAEADTTLTFTKQADAAPGASWARAHVLQPGIAPAPGAPVPPDAPPALLALRGASLTVGSSPPRSLPFPGGKRPVAPEGLLVLDWNNDFRPDLALAGAA